MNHMAHEEDALRAQIAGMLKAGLKTEITPFPEDSNAFAQLLQRIREEAGSDLEKKLVISGFTDYPMGEDQQRCQECMYYLNHRRWCDLPELDVPVEPDWWCRLWRI
ncbi:endonuclease V [Acidithiobacillus ferridurans]|uniref:hypothetical protein n=1 Tax=Acidithiobacillus ferridurans TaxID=1232575 RepID=UPI001C065D09|nr:hypothetical protein [Acidithiobacillus ferridurans]MBU2732223.1 hypothetical protein [Acidithiobacillus ferridurans]